MRVVPLALALVALLCGCGVPAPQPSPADDATALPVGPALSTPPVPAGLVLVPSATPEPARPASGVVRLAAVGDLMLARDITSLMDEHGSVHPFEGVRALLEEADLTIANMEGTFSERGSAASKLYTFRTPSRHARGLADAGIDVVALGNNHTMDFGEPALVDTIAALDAAGVRNSGAGLDSARARAPAILESNGLRIAFLSYNAVLEATFATAVSPGVARAETAAIHADVTAALTDADVVVVSMHAGTEYTDAPTTEQRALAYAAIDAGAALVLGSHPHVLQGWERYNGGIIVYSLGNFVFDLDPDDLATLGARPFQTLVFLVELTREGARNATYEPVFIDPVENRPLPATAEQAAGIEQRLRTLGIVR